MIVTLTMNPALDRTVQLDAPLEVGEVQQAVSSREDAAGKGINVAKVLAAAGTPVTAVLPLAPGDPYAAALSSQFGTLTPNNDEHGLVIEAVEITGEARVNLTITDPAGETTKINLAGPQLSAEAGERLINATVTAADGASWLALCGSLPPGAGDDFYVRVIRAVRERAAKPPMIAVDTSGAALAETVAHGHPDLIKPNEIELAELAGVPVPTGSGAEAVEGAAPEQPVLARAVADIAGTLVPSRVGSALVTLGGDGAVLVTADGATHASIPPGVTVRSTVGAGDSSLAGYLLARVAGSADSAALESAVRHGSATAALPGTRLATPEDLPQGAVALTTL